jgi:hypothetical protein
VSAPEGEVSIEIDAKKYTGRYRLDGKGLLHVSFGLYSKATHHRGPGDPRGYYCASWLVRPAGMVPHER